MRTTFQVRPDKVSEEARKEIQNQRGKTAALEAERSSGTLGDATASQCSAKGFEERKREGNGYRRSSLYEKKSKRWGWRGEDERTQNKLRVEVSKAMAQLVRHSHKGQVRFEWNTEGQGNLKSLDDETLFVMIRMSVRDRTPSDEKIRFVLQHDVDRNFVYCQQEKNVRGNEKRSL